MCTLEDTWPAFAGKSSWKRAARETADDVVGDERQQQEFCSLCRVVVCAVRFRHSRCSGRVRSLSDLCLRDVGALTGYQMPFQWATLI